MHVLVAHNHYVIAGGEDGVVDAECRLLESNGVRVSRFEVSNTGIQGWRAAAKVGLQAAYSQESARRLGKVIAAERPDVLHVHNFFPLLTPSVYDAARAHRVPVVQTLHNYRTICAAATLLRNGKVCTKCVHGSAMWSVVHGCYRGSRLASLGVARMIRKNHSWGTWNQKVDKFICLTEFARSVFMDAGFSPGRMVVKPNFVEEPELLLRGAGSYALYVGRLSAEKGIDVLLEAWQKIGEKIPLRIAGDGPLASRVEKQADGRRIQYLGRLPREAVLKQMRGAGCLIAPSICFEGAGPLTILEAKSVGVPTVASRMGSLAEAVNDEEDGVLFEPGSAEALSNAVLRVMTTPGLHVSLGEGARRDYLEKYTAEKCFASLERIYRDVTGAGHPSAGDPG